MIEIGESKQLARHNYFDVAVILPAHNEEVGVGETVQSFLHALPGCTVVVCDNASTDKTAEVAAVAGAIVIDEPLLGKGNAVRRLLSTVNAAIYVMADADTTYDADASRNMIALLAHQHLDMVTGVRVSTNEQAYRRGHVLGNMLFNRLFSGLFMVKTQDVFSGYRVLSRRLAKSLPIQSTGFEVETEISAVAAVLKLSTGELRIKYYPRLSGSYSKLNTYRDGFRIFRTYIRLLRHFRPKVFYGILSACVWGLSFTFGAPVILNFLDTGLVPRLPTAVLASSLGIISCLIFLLGILLEAVSKSQLENRKLALLNNVEKTANDK